VRDAKATIDNIPVNLGDVVSGPAVGIFTNGRVNGISPDGTMLDVGWLGIVPVADCQWAADMKETQFARLYRVATENQWAEPADSEPNPAVTTSLIQLELELVTSANELTSKNRPCGVVLDGLKHERLIPGLDADLCRCPDCTKRADGGIWWFNSWMREQVLKRRTAYRFKLTDGETLRDNAE
jgi:hypothetical protein